MKNQEPSSLAEILKNKSKTPAVKPPAYDWQEKALWVIKELNVPPSKKSSVFQICKKTPPHIIERAVNDTKELMPTGEKWRYFFKIISASK
ncbi:MAG: hypothetical protein PHO58_04995 [Bacilli bacterium]|nr:hypothetical protein [Bacilli bacterium]